MNTSDYRDEIGTLRDSIAAYKACVSYDEREQAADRLGRHWKRMALLEQPKRLPQSERDRCQRVLNQAAELLNAWVIESGAGRPEIEEYQAPPEAAMRDTMRFCAMMKRHGLS